MNQSPEKRKARREVLRARGICYNCQCRKTEGGKAVCSVCYDRKIAQRNRTKGTRCTRCGRELMEHAVLTGQLSCWSCLEYANAVAARNY